ncbi:MAG: SDR family oxidoreductase [Deltaproteobacteria bacterium]|nr:SDR family oxidoreductase [Deltaproteobacteria bacterium]
MRTGRLEGKVALITGAGSGMGRASAQLFAREGARVVVVDWNREGGEETVRAITETGGSAAFCAVDVSKEAEVKAAVEFAVATYGGLDIMFNNAGIAGIREGRDALVADLEADDWDYTHSINLKGVFFGCKHAIPELIKRGGGAIVNTASAAAIQGSGFPIHAYTAAKGGVVALTRAIAVGYGRENIRANSIIAGAIATPMSNYYQDEWVRKMYEEAIPLGRVGEAQDIAYAALYLASDEARFVTGHALVVDGGKSIKG